MRRPVYLLSVACGISLAAGCGTMRSSPPVVQGSIKAAATTNPDPRGRPSPIVMRLYELKSAATFNSADFFALFDKESETLGGDLVGREEYDLRPNETRPYRGQLQADTKVIGVVAAFRNLEKIPLAPDDNGAGEVGDQSRYRYRHSGRHGDREMRSLIPEQRQGSP